jgi:outer membrane biosynthesis protein TonB
MKLKYYLRGLGIGMAVTALILGISFSGRQGQEAQTLTDEQIRERASELGMVDSSELTLAALQNSAQPQTTMEPEVTEEPKLTADPETTTEPEATAELETTTEPKATTEPETMTDPEATVEPETMTEPETTAEPKMTTEPEATEELELTTAPEQSQTTITIKKGSDSGSVSRMFYEAGLVENAKAFDNYLCNNGYSRSINPGIYEIAPGTSEEEIAKIITGKH